PFASPLWHLRSFFFQFRRKIGNWTCGLAVSHDDLACDEGPMGTQEVLVVLADDGPYCRRTYSSHAIGALALSRGSRRRARRLWLRMLQSFLDASAWSRNGGIQIVVPN